MLSKIKTKEEAKKVLGKLGIVRLNGQRIATMKSNELLELLKCEFPKTEPIIEPQIIEPQIIEPQIIEPQIIEQPIEKPIIEQPIEQKILSTITKENIEQCDLNKNLTKKMIQEEAEKMDGIRSNYPKANSSKEIFCTRLKRVLKEVQTITQEPIKEKEPQIIQEPTIPKVIQIPQLQQIGV